MQETNPGGGGSLQLLLLLVFLIPAILFLIAQQNVLKTIQPQNRTMGPGQVWLQMIPLFGLIWQFIVVTRIADSIKNEIASRQDDSILGFPDMASVEELDKKPSFAIGISYCVLTTVAIIINLMHEYTSQIILQLVAVCMLSGIICWVIYWVKISGYKKKIKMYDAAVAK